MWTRGTTEAINLVAASWGGANLGPGDEVLVTVSDHYSNLVPWQVATRRVNATLRASRRQLRLPLATRSAGRAPFQTNQAGDFPPMFRTSSVGSIPPGKFANNRRVRS